MEGIATQVLDSLIEGCQVIGFDYRYLYVNDTVAAQGKASKEQLIGRTMMECYPGIENTPMFSTLRECMTERKHHRLENEFAYPDGSKGWFELRFLPVPAGICILSLDITEAKRTAQALARSEEQFRQAQKMEAVGRLAGGVAHDFNNVLSVILSYAQILADDVDPSDPTREDLEEITKAAQRAAGLTRQLLAFSRQQVLEPKIVDLNEIVSGMDKMVRRLAGEDVEIKIVVPPGLGKVLADPGHLEQVLMNLVVNARDAMPMGGRLTIETQNAELDATYASSHLGVVPGPYVMLAVSDTGIGMDKATQERIFEPFFTTKERGRGTGLGLATVFGIVKQSRGSIWVYSEPGAGSTFRIYLPRTDVTEIREVATVEVATVRGSETILLVEDEEQLRKVAHEILDRNGYRVLEAKHGAEALLLFENYPEQIHLLITDVIMPEMTGREVADRLLALRPDLKVLFMSSTITG